MMLGAWNPKKSQARMPAPCSARRPGLRIQPASRRPKKCPNSRRTSPRALGSAAFPPPRLDEPERKQRFGEDALKCVIPSCPTVEDETFSNQRVGPDQQRSNQDF